MTWEIPVAYQDPAQTPSEALIVWVITDDRLVRRVRGSSITRPVVPTPDQLAGVREGFMKKASTLLLCLGVISMGIIAGSASAAPQATPSVAGGYYPHDSFIPATTWQREHGGLRLGRWADATPVAHHRRQPCLPVCPQEVQARQARLEEGQQAVPECKEVQATGLPGDLV